MVVSMNGDKVARTIAGLEAEVAELGARLKAA
jgi:hypothetical protein